MNILKMKRCIQRTRSRADEVVAMGTVPSISQGLENRNLWFGCSKLIQRHWSLRGTSKYQMERRCLMNKNSFCWLSRQYRLGTQFSTGILNILTPCHLPSYAFCFSEPNNLLFLVCEQQNAFLMEYSSILLRDIVMNLRCHNIQYLHNSKVPPSVSLLL